MWWALVENDAVTNVFELTTTAVQSLFYAPSLIFRPPLSDQTASPQARAMTILLQAADHTSCAYVRGNLWKEKAKAKPTIDACSGFGLVLPSHASRSSSRAKILKKNKD